jgi:hypothetical protein
MTTTSYAGTYASKIDKLLLELTACAQGCSESLTLKASTDDDRTTLVQTTRHAFTGQVTEAVGVSVVTSLQLLWPSSDTKEQVTSWVENADLTILHLLRSNESGESKGAMMYCNVMA